MMTQCFVIRRMEGVGVGRAGLACLMIGVWMWTVGCSTSQTPSNDGPNPPSSNGTGDPVTFSNGGFEVSARTTLSETMTTTTVEEAGQTLVEMEATVEEITLTFPTEGGSPARIVFNTPLAAPPSEFAGNRLATYVAGQLYGVGGGLRPDNPGCDMMLDTRCTLRCCADHDRCFAENGCTFLSWLTTVFVPGSGLINACSNCNSVAAQCIVFACASSDEGDPTSDVCFDASCGANYTCPPPNEFDCYACTTPCGNSPSSCGNGSCEVQETAENCASDCATGLGLNTCCVANNNCPSETATSCPGDCCCCGLGEVCGTGQVCGFVSDGSTRVDPTPVTP